MNANHTPGPWIRMGRGIGVPGGELLTLWALDGREVENAKLVAAAPDLLADLAVAADTLRRYEALHRSKNTEDSLAKAEVNAALAARFEATIAKATE